MCSWRGYVRVHPGLRGGESEMQKIQTCIMLIQFHLSLTRSHISRRRETRQKASSVTGNEAAGLFNKIWPCGLGRVKKGSGRLNGDNYPSCARAGGQRVRNGARPRNIIYTHVAQMKFHANLRRQTPGQIEFHLP